MKVLAIDSVILNDLQACGRKVLYGHVENLRPNIKEPYFEKGDLMHVMLKMYYKLAKHRPNYEMPEIMDICTRLGRKHYIKFNLSVEECEDVIRYFEFYARHYGREKFKVIAVEKVFARKLFEDDNLLIVYQGIADIISEYPNDPTKTVIDHKTGSRDETPLSLSNQFIGYAWAFDTQRVIVNKINFYKGIITALENGSPIEEEDEKKAFKRYVLAIPKDVIEEWVDNTTWWVKEHLVKYLDGNIFPYNLTSCDKYAGCRYVGICSQERRARDFIKKSNFHVEEQWDVAKALK